MTPPSPSAENPDLLEVGIFCISCGYVGKSDDCGCGPDAWHVAVFADRRELRSGDAGVSPFLPRPATT